MSAVETKDHLLSLLNQCEDCDTLVASIKSTFIPIFKHTVGMWQELKYCYKAAEILHSIRSSLDVYISNSQHHKTTEMLQSLRMEVVKLEEMYFQLQQESFQTA